MRSGVAGFIAGIGLLQMCAGLPDHPWLVLLGSAALACLWGGRRLPQAAIPLRLSAGFLLGFCWASTLAHHALADALDPALEGQDLVVTGVVESLPNRAGDGIRFNFNIESARRDGLPVAVPAHVSLGWYAERAGRGAAAADAGEAEVDPPAAGFADVQPGERWQLLLRLQRPHGNANPEGFDYEVWLLEQGLRATGQVRNRGAPTAGAASNPEEARVSADSPLVLAAPASAVNLRRDAFVARFGTLVERWRALIRDRILAALPGKPYAGAMVALVIGDQRAIPQSDWTIFNRTGIGHLVSISGS